MHGSTMFPVLLQVLVSKGMVNFHHSIHAICKHHSLPTLFQLPGSANRWPCTRTISSQQQSAPVKASQEGRPTLSSFGSSSTRGFQLTRSTDFDLGSTMELPTQNGFIIDWQGAKPFPRETTMHDANGIRRFPIVSNCIAFNNAIVSDFSNGANMAATHVNCQQGIGGVATSPLVGSAGKAATIGTSSKAPAVTAQMTIFYAGAVNVYNIPLDKASEIISFASSKSNMHQNSTSMRQNVAASSDELIRAMNINKSPTATDKEPRSKDPSSPASVTSHFVGGAVKPENSIGGNMIDLSVIQGFHSPSLIKALPMARKASLARFLERRKERLANAVPYISAQKSAEHIKTNNDTNATDAASAGSSEPFSFLGASSSKSDPKPPSTKLEM